jgi:REP element-mobilizing transposase RayT
VGDAMNHEHRRKPNRIPDFDYSQNYAYFITMCAENRQCVFGAVVDGGEGQAALIRLSDVGMIADQSIQAIPVHYPSVRLENYVIMPNHIHLLLRLENPAGEKAVSVSKVIQQFKGYVTKQIGRSVWQKLYYDHVIRDANDFAVRWQYIENNPYRWLEDKYYICE